MFRIIYYVDAKGVSELENYLRELKEKSRTNKNARIRFNSIHRYIRYLSDYGTEGLPSEYVKHLTDDIWELRPDRYRILYFYFKDNTIVLLHHFVKKTRKTPKEEIRKAKKERDDYVKRNS